MAFRRGTTIGLHKELKESVQFILFSLFVTLTVVCSYITVVCVCVLSPGAGGKYDAAHERQMQQIRSQLKQKGVGASRAISVT